MIKNNKFIKILPAIIIIIGFINSIITKDISFNAFESLPGFANFQYKLITMPEIYIAMFIMFIYLIAVFIYDAIASKKQDTENIKAKKVIFISNIVVICLSVICVFLSSFSFITTENTPIPEKSQGKYLDVNDFGIGDKITDIGFSFGDVEISNEIRTKKTVSAELTLTKESYYIGDTHFYVYQDILEYRNEKTALKVAELLSSGKNTEYKETGYEGFGKVYVSYEDLIGVIGNTVYRITIITNDNTLRPDSNHLLEAIKNRA
ncbi:MAG: hypothetical protein IKW03_08095 [Clostridia bacterium]|nr:hypothetical protein [Clostridia bacterium]